MDEGEGTEGRGVDGSTGAGGGGTEGRGAGAVGTLGSARANDLPLRNANNSCSSFVIRSSADVETSLTWIIPFDADDQDVDGAMLYMRDGVALAGGFRRVHSSIRSLIKRPGMFRGVYLPVGSTILPSLFFLHLPSLI